MRKRGRRRRRRHLLPVRVAGLSRSPRGEELRALGPGADARLCPVGLGGGGGGGGGESQADVPLHELAALQAVQLRGSLGAARRPASVLHEERVLHQDLQELLHKTTTQLHTQPRGGGSLMLSPHRRHNLDFGV